MSARRFGLVLVLLFLPASARAHAHKAGAFVGGLFPKGSSLKGFQVAAEITLPKSPEKVRLWSVFFGAGAASGSHEGGHRSQGALTSGLRFTYPFGRWKDKDWKIEPFAHVLGACVLTQDSTPSASDTGGGGGFGAGVAVGGDTFVVRAQYDYARLWWSGEIARDYRSISVGVEFRFRRPPPAR
jgi:hypothetical protein